ncbi:MAG: TetR/AcrR family transcriptional regulator [Rhodoglobus sp.]
MSPPKTSRAAPLSVDDRRAMIIAAVAPVLRTHGPAVTSRQLAEAAGIAEGTIYRAFADKDDLIRASIDAHTDPAPLLRALENIDPALGLEQKMCHAVSLVRQRFRSVVSLMSLFGEYRKRPPSHHHAAMNSSFAVFLAPQLDSLTLTPERVAHLVQLLAFSASMPHFDDHASFTDEELTAIILHGIWVPASLTP